MLQFHIYDVFTDTPYQGNPLAIVEGAGGLSTAHMQAMAREFNLSETIFILAPEEAAHTARVRIFTPSHEMPFAGHPTVGCAVHLALSGGEGPVDTIVTLEENAGLVPVTVVGDSSAIRAEFVAPVQPEAVPLGMDKTALAAAIGLEPGDIGPHAAHVVSGGHPFVFIPVASRAALSQAWPAAGWPALTQAAGTGSAYLYTPGSEADYEARMFAPGGGIAEDPATGSATSLLSAQLLANGALGDGTTDLKLCQGRDMGRLSHLGLSVDVAQGAITQIRVSGGAVAVSSGLISPPA